MRAAMAAGLAICAATAFGAGCSGDTLTLDPVASAAEKTQAVGTVRISSTGRIQEEGRTRIESSHWVVDFDRRRAHRVDEDLSDVIYDGDTVYIARSVGTEKRWSKWRSTGIGVGIIEAYQPQRLLDALRASGTFDEVGNALVRGVETTRHQGTVDLAELKKQFKNSSDAEDGSARVEVFIDEDGLLRRLHFDVGERGEFTMELFDFGKPANIKIPSADEVDELDFDDFHLEEKP